MATQALGPKQKLALLTAALIFPVVGGLHGNLSQTSPAVPVRQQNGDSGVVDAKQKAIEVHMNDRDPTVQPPAEVIPTPNELRIKRSTAAPAGVLKVKVNEIELIQFDAQPLADAMKLFSEETGLNVICSAKAGQTPISVFLRNVEPMAALDAIVKANGLFFRIEEDSQIVRIATADEYENDLTSFRDEQTKVFTLLYPNPVAVAQVISQIYGSRVELNMADADTQDLLDLSNRFSRFDLVDGRSLGLGTFDAGNGGNGGGGGGANGQGGGLGMNPLAAGGLAGLAGVGGANGGLFGGQGPGSAINNANSMRSNRRENSLISNGQELGVNGEIIQNQRDQATIYVSTVRRNNQIVVRTGDQQSMVEIEQLVRQLDVPTATVLLEVKVLRIVLGDGFNSAFEYFGGGRSQSTSFSDGQLQSPFPGGNSAGRAIAAGLGVAGSVPGALSFQVVDNNFQFRMQLLESQNRVTALATPLILTANNEVSRIFVGDTLPFTVGFTPSQVVGGLNSAAGAVAATPITELRDVGQSLLITPNINADRTVTLRVVEENSERVVGGASIPIPDAAGAGVTAVNVDTVRRRTVSGTLVAQDGMAVVLGGLIEEKVSDGKDQIPVLGRLPGIGFIFRRQFSTRSRSELIVMIRPHVFNTPSESAASSQTMLGELSMHPNSPNAAGTMNTYLPCKVIRSDPECLERASILRFHTVTGSR